MPELTLREVQLGQSATSSQNFLIATPSVPDGTMSIRRGNGTHVLDIDASGFIKITTPNTYANDGAAATGGVPVGGLYRNGSVVQVRVA